MGHALRVSAGLDSLVVGEGQILSQMKACYANAIEGAGGKVTSRLLNTAVAAGKRARDETDISKGAVSISSAAYELAAERAPLDLAGLELENARVLIVGAGKMTRLLLTHMASHGAVGRKCTILNRSYQRAKDMADEYKEGYDVDIDVVASDGDEQVAYDLAKDADIIFTASSAVDYIFDAETIASLERQAGREKLMLVDIAVPRNVDPDCDQLDDVRAYDVDSLKAVVERNTAKRRREIVEAEKLLEEEQAVPGLDHVARRRAGHHEAPDEGRGFAAGGAEARGQEIAISILARDRGRGAAVARHRVQIVARAHVVAARRGVDGRQEEHAVGAQEDVRRMRRRGRLTVVYL